MVTVVEQHTGDGLLGEGGAVVLVTTLLVLEPGPEQDPATAPALLVGAALAREVQLRRISAMINAVSILIQACVFDLSHGFLFKDFIKY